MSTLYNDDAVEDCIWSLISQSHNSADFLTYIQQFQASDRHRAQAMDKAVSTFLPAMNSIQSGYLSAVDALRELIQNTSDQKVAASAWFNIGKMLQNGYGAVVDHEASIEAYERAIALGEVRSLVNLASHYESGTGVSVDLDKARALFQRAADLQVSLGYTRLADMLPEDGIEQRKDNYLKAAELNCQVALYRIALNLYRGEEGFAKDTEKGIAWMTRSARAGHAYACYHLGWAYEHGREVKRDPQTAADWYRLGAERLDRSCLRALGVLHFYGVGAEEDYEAAMRLFRQAAVLGEPSSQRRLGHELIWGALNKDDEERLQVEGVAWLRLADQGGDDRAAELLGRAYRRGTGVAKDLAKSAEYLLKAAKAGIAEAQGQTGLNYWFGNGVEENHTEAYKWLSMCALQGEARGLYLLGRASEVGVGCTKDPKEAFRLYQQAAEKGESDAVYQLGECCYFGSGTEKDPQQAVVHYRRAAALGHARAKTDLGLILHEGKYVATNYEEAARWFAEAAEQQEPRAMYMFGLMYESGDGVGQNDEQARRWIARAAMLDHKPAKEWIEQNLPDRPQWLEQLVNPNE